MAACSPPAPAQVITTVAGSDFVFRGDGGLAVSAPFGVLYGLAIDSSGNLITGDYYNNLVVKISPKGVLTVVAGNQFFGFSGDGGPATAASLGLLAGVAVDAAGDIYIGDSTNCRVRRVGRDGIILTVAGNDQCTFAGDGGPASVASLDAVQSISPPVTAFARWIPTGPLPRLRAIVAQLTCMVEAVTPVTEAGQSMHP
jgi:hypothetical protein